MSRRRFSEWCTRWGTRRNKPGQRAGRPRIASPRRQARRLLLEALEHRWTPASFLVQTSGDDISAAPLAGSGTPADPFQMSSLRAAIIAANRSKGADTIAFSPAVDGKPITLLLPNQSGVNEDAGLSGDLDVTDSLTIIGDGPTNTIIQAGTNETNGIDKVLAINPGRLDAIDFSLSGATVRFGRNTQPFAAKDSSFTAAGLDWFGGRSGSLSISNSVISNNTNLNGYGGGINIDTALGAQGNVTINNSSIINNASAGPGAGMNVLGDHLQVSIAGSTLSNNRALARGDETSSGGGIHINLNPLGSAPLPLVKIDATTILGNQSIGPGGGVAVDGGNQDVNITSTAIVGNSSRSFGGSSSLGGGLWQANNSGTTTLSSVLIATNHAEEGSAAAGGGIAGVSGLLVIQNSTISGNRSAGDAGGIVAARSSTGQPTVTLLNATIANNRADSSGSGKGAGGGINAPAGAIAKMVNTIIDENFRGTGSTSDDINGLVLADFSLIGTSAGATITGTNNQLDVGARLGPLADNGAPPIGPAGFASVLQTQALLPGSPALDAGDNSAVLGILPTDQRGAGFPRVLDSADQDTIATVDLGAFEAPSPPSGFDFGDAPNSYHTLLASDGPRHGLGSGLFLGASVDAEPDGQPGATASSDGGDDGVTLPGMLIAGLSATASVVASQPGKLDAWIDFNRNGTFEAEEQIAASLPVAAGANAIAFAIPSFASPGATFARFRLSSAGGLAPTGAAKDGEVEDYAVRVVVPGADTAVLVDDPASPGQKVLIATGTSKADTIQIQRTANGTLLCKRGCKIAVYPAGLVGRVVIFGLAGNDTIKMPANLNLPVEIFGGAGNDVLYGGSGNDALVGGSGNDQLHGGAGRDVLIGGTGADRLFGESGDDILIGGGAAKENDSAALDAIAAAWSAKGDFPSRIASLAGLLNPATVIDDKARDTLNGGGGQDWFLDFLLTDSIIGFNANPATGDKRN